MDYLQFAGLLVLSVPCRGCKGGEIMSKITLGSKLLKALGIGAKGSSNALKIGALGGLSTFFSLEWLTGGGLVRSVGGSLGVSDIVASILLIVVVTGALCLAFYAVYKKIWGSK